LWLDWSISEPKALRLRYDVGHAPPPGVPSPDPCHSMDFLAMAIAETAAAGDSSSRESTAPGSCWNDSELRGGYHYQHYRV